MSDSPPLTKPFIFAGRERVACAGAASKAYSHLEEPWNTGASYHPVKLKRATELQCVCAFRNERGSLSQDSKGLHFPDFNQVFWQRLLGCFLFQPAGLFLSLKQPQNPERWGQISFTSTTLPSTAKDLCPCSPQTPPIPSPSPNVAASCGFWRGKNGKPQGCWQQPHCLALKSEPSGGVKEVRTVPTETALSLVAAPHQLDHRARGGRHEETTPMPERFGPVVFETQRIPEFTLLPSFSCFCTCFF